MAHIKLDSSLLHTLKDKVVVLTGGATGIGRSAVEQFHQCGALVVFGDVADKPALELELSLGSRVRFVHCDTTSYADQLSMFAIAEKEFGKVDIVVANAGIINQINQFADGEDISKEPSLREIDVNVKGTLFSARIGLSYLRKNSEGGDLILTSSVAGFSNASGLTPYVASKHAVLGIARSLWEDNLRHGVRIVAICPFMTKTATVKTIEHAWNKMDFPRNEPSDVALAFLAAASANRGNGVTHQGAVIPFTGKILFVSGGKMYEIADRLLELQSEWLGVENNQALRRVREYFTSGNASWDPRASG